MTDAVLDTSNGLSNPDSLGKLTGLMQASLSKQTSLNGGVAPVSAPSAVDTYLAEQAQNQNETVAAAEARLRADAKAWAGGYGANPVLNLAADAATGTARAGGYLASLPANVSVAYNLARTDQSLIDAFNAEQSKTATSEQIALLEQPSQIISGPNDKSTNRDFLNKTIGRAEIAEDVNTAVSGVTEGISDAKDKNQLVASLGQAWNNNTGALETGAAGLKALATNGMGVAGYVAENIPQLLLGGASRTALAMTNAGYSMDIFNKGVKDVMNKNNGKLPTVEQTQEILGWSLAAGAAEQVGELAQLNAFKGIGKAVGVADSTIDTTVAKLVDNLPKLFSGATAKIAGATGKTAVVEGVTEAFQTAVEEDLSKLRDIQSGKEIFTGGFIGGASGGVIGGIGKTAAVAVDAAAKNLASANAKIEEVQARKQELTTDIATGNIQKYTDVTEEKYDPTTAVAVLNARNQVEDVTEEEKVQNTTSAKQALAKQLQLVIGIGTKLESATGDEYKSLSKQFDQESKKYDQVEALVKEMSPTKTDAEITQAINELSVEDTSPKAQTLKQDILGSMRIDSGSVSVEQAVQLAQSPNLSDMEKAEVEAFIKVEEAQNYDKSQSTVHEDVIYGGKGFIGSNQYRTAISSALVAGDTATATQQLKGLTNFAEQRNAKAELVASAYEPFARARAQGVDPRSVQLTPEERAKIVTVGNTYKTLKGAPLRIHSGTPDSLINGIKQEAVIVNATLEEAKARMASVAPKVVPEVQTPAPTNKTSTNVTEEVIEAPSEEVPTLEPEDTPPWIEGQPPNFPKEVNEPIQEEAKLVSKKEAKLEVEAEEKITSDGRLKGALGEPKGAPLEEVQKYLDATTMPLDQVVMKGDDYNSPWLMADGTIVGTGGDHIDLSFTYGYDGYRDMSLATGAIRAGFHKNSGDTKEEGDPDSFVSLQVFDDQKLTSEQYATVKYFVEATGAEILLGVDKSGNNLNNTAMEQVSLDELSQHVTGNISKAEVANAEAQVKETKQVEQTQSKPVVQEAAPTGPYNLAQSLTNREAKVDTVTAGNIKKVNWVSQWFTPRNTMNAETHSILQNEPDVLKRVLSKEVDVSSYIRDTITPAQENVLTTVAEFNKVIASNFKELFIPKANPDFRSDDMMQFFADEQGNIDPNVISALSIAAFNWIGTGSSASLVNYQSDINGILGREDDEWVSKEAYTLLGNAGLPKDVVLSSIGQQVVALLGLQATKNTPANLEVKLEQSMGNWAVGMLLDMGILNENVVDLTSIGGNEEYAIFYSIDAITDETGKRVHGEQPQIIVDSFKDTSGFLSKVFGAEAFSTGPLMSKPSMSKVRPSRKGTNLKITEDEHKAITAHSQIPHSINQSVNAVFNSLSDDNLLAISGFNPNLETLHDENKKGAESKNNSIYRGIQHYRDFVAGLPSLDTLFYFKHEVWKQGRIGLVSNTVNPQASKIHRSLVNQQEWKTEVKFTDSKAMTTFWVFVAQAFDLNADKQSDATTLTKVKAFVNDPVVQEGISAIREVLKGVTPTETQQEAIVAAVAKGELEMHSLNGLVALAEFQEAASNPKNTSFTTHMWGEIDGITNGPIIGTLQLMGARDWADMVTKLNRGGIFFDGVNESFPEYKEKTFGLKDSYEAIAGVWNQALSAMNLNTEEVGLRNAVGSLFKAYNAETNEFNIPRAMAKNPLMVTIYGSSVSSIMDSMTDELISNIYTKMEQLFTPPNGQEQRQADLDNFNVLMRHVTGLPDFTLYGEDLLTFKIDNNTKNYIRKNMGNIFGTTLEESININHGVLIARRRIVNQAMDLVFQLFSAQRDKLIAAETAKQIAEGKIVEGVTTISKADIAAIDAKLLAATPIMNNYFSAKSGNIEEGLMMMKKVKTKQSKPSKPVRDNYETNEEFNQAITEYKKGLSLARNYSAETTFARPLNTNSGTKSITSYGSINEYAAGGVAPTVLAVQSIDGANMIKAMMDGSKFLNVHDAYIGGVGSLVETAQKGNKNFYDINQEYSILEQAMETLNRAMEYAHINDPETFNAVTSKAKMSYESNGMTSKLPVREWLHEVKRELKSVDKQKATTFKRMTSMGQFGFNGGSYVIESAIKGNATEVVNTNEGVIRSIQEIDTAVGNKEVPLQSGGNIDPDTFTPLSTQEVNKSNAVEVFDYLGLIDSQINFTDSLAHNSYLRNVLSQAMEKVLEPFKLHMDSRSDLVTQGAITGSDMYLLHQGLGISPVHSGMLMANSRMTTQETFVHELVHLISREGINSGTGTALRDLELLWGIAKDKVTVEDLMNVEGVQANSPEWAYEYETARNRWNHIFTPRSTTQSLYDSSTGSNQTIEVSPHLHEFLAFGITNAKFREKLATIKTPIKKETKLWEGTNLQDKLMNLFIHAIEWLNGKIDKVYSSTDGADIRLDHLYLQLIMLEQSNKNKVWNAIQSSWDFTASNLGVVTQAVRSAINKGARSDLVTNSGSAIVRAGGTVGKLIGGNKFAQYVQVMEEISESMATGKQGHLGRVMNEFKGRNENNSAAHDLLRVSNKDIDQARKHIEQYTKKLLMNEFSDTTKDERIGMNAAVLKSDLSVLDGVYSHADMAKLMTDANYLNSEISNRITGLQKYGNHRVYFQRHAENLGVFMASGTTIEEFTLLNAHNIVESTGSTTIKLAEDLKPAAKVDVDILATLYSLVYTSDKHRIAAGKVISKEISKGTNNGFALLLEIHKRNKEQSLVKNFDGQEALMLKGYTKEIMNPHVSLAVGPLYMEDEMLAKGYVRSDNPLPRDPRDMIVDKMYLYKNPNGGLETYSAGIVGMTSLSAKGTGYLALHTQDGAMSPALAAQQDINRMHGLMQTAANKMFRVRASNAKAKFSNNLIPVVSGKGDITDYRYVMSEGNKNDLLEKNNDFLDVMSSMESDIISKVNTKNINRRAVEELRAKWVNRRPNTNGAFVVIGAKVSDPYFREIYAMLPADMKRDIKDVWGTDSMRVPRDQVELYFGQRKLSVSSLWKAHKDDLPFYQQLIRGAFEIVLGKKAPVRAKNIEDLLREFMHEAKDIIVIKTGVILAGNMISNALLLKMAGVPIQAIVKGHVTAIKGAREYQKDKEQVFALKNKLELQDLTYSQRKAMEESIAILNNRIARNPVRDLIEAGVLQTIVDDVALDEDNSFSFKTKWAKKTEKFTKGLPGPIKEMGKLMYLSHDTSAYKFLHNMTQLSDFIGRFVLYNHLTTKAEGKLDHKEAVGRVVDIFINYDLPTHPVLQYANDVGVLWFTKYYFRVQRILINMLRDNPENVILVQALQYLVGDVSDIYDSNLLVNGVLSRLHSPLDALSAPSEIITIKLASGAL